MEHSIILKRANGSLTVLQINPLTINEITSNRTLIKLLSNKGIVTSEDFLKKIVRKSEIKLLTSNKRSIKNLESIYDKLTEGFFFKSYSKRLSSLLKNLKDSNLRLTESDRSIIGTCIIFKKIISDKWKFLKTYISKKLQRKLSAQENKWEKIFKEYFN